MKEEVFKFTKSQIALKEKLEVFLDSSNRIFRLTGPPGVGKTTMIYYCLKKLINLDIKNGSKGSNMNVCGITFAHQAKKVLGKSIPNVFTFAKAYGMKEIHKDDGSISFEYDRFSEGSPIGEFSIPVFVHDEVSQYTPEMLRIVLEKTSVFSKIIFMGDRAQLPPVDSGGTMKIDEDSPVFDLDLSEECKHELTERVRQTKNNSILDLSDIIREEIFGTQNVSRVLSLIREHNIKKGNGYSFIPYKELKSHYKDSQGDKTLISFRRKTIKYFNDELRNFLLDNPKEEIISGDLMCMSDNYYKISRDGRVEYVIHNSDILSLKNVFKKKVKINKVFVEVYSAEIEDSSKIFMRPTEKGRVVFEEELSRMAELCKAKKMRWDLFWNTKKKFCSANYAYAITAYKAQGSTYDIVYVDINDILLTRPLTPKRKLQTIYTAMTRARKAVYFLKGN